MAEPLPPFAGIREVIPAIARPQGGQMIALRGFGFKPPLRVFFDVGRDVPIEAFVSSVADSEILVVTPSVEIAAPAQRLKARILLVNDVGGRRESTETADNFFFLNETLTPSITTAVPQRGPVTGGFRVTLFGSAFQLPVRVFFGSEEARVISSRYEEIIVISPPSSDARVVPIRVENINSNTVAVLENAFRYEPNLMIDRIDPASGPASGGTRVTIDGAGMSAPLAVSFAGVPAQPLRITPASTLAMTGPVQVRGCVEVTGPVEVINIATGEATTGPAFTYIPMRPVIARVEPRAVNPGEKVRVSVTGVPRGQARFTIGQRAVLPVSVRTVNGADEYEFVMPALDRPAAHCAEDEKTRRVPPVYVEVTVSNAENACAVTRLRALVLRPSDDPCSTPGLNPAMSRGFSGAGAPSHRQVAAPDARADVSSLQSAGPPSN
jgi:IPT/TIG domain-containing protein